MWETLAAIILTLANVKKKKRLYTVWHSDRKSIRSRVLLRQKTNNVKNKDEDKIETGSETKDKNVKK